MAHLLNLNRIFSKSQSISAEKDSFNVLSVFGFWQRYCRWKRLNGTIGWELIVCICVQVTFLSPEGH